MEMPEEKQIRLKLESISSKIQKQIKDLEITFQQVNPMAEKFGYRLDSKTGKLIKLKQC